MKYCTYNELPAYGYKIVAATMFVANDGTKYQIRDLVCGDTAYALVKLVPLCDAMMASTQNDKGKCRCSKAYIASISGILRNHQICDNEFYRHFIKYAMNPDLWYFPCMKATYFSGSIFAKISWRIRILKNNVIAKIFHGGIVDMDGFASYRYPDFKYSRREIVTPTTPMSRSENSTDKSGIHFYESPEEAIINQIP